ncbi:MAG: leucyl aminopeptidase [Alphaproteobacteria bacterium]|nr:leucyl aminopeptidase [Alphaproteobacteria bacterium]
MTLRITFPKADTTPKGHIVVTVFEGDTLSTAAKKIDKALDGLVASAMKKDKSFKGKLGQVLTLYAPEKSKIDRVTILGLGKTDDFDSLKAEEAGGKLFAAIGKAGSKDIMLVTEKSKALKNELAAAHLANGFSLRAYNFDRYKSKKDSKDDAPKLAALKVLSSHPANSKAAFDALDSVTSGTFWARDLVNTAPNDLYPDSYAKQIRDELKPLDVSVEILDEKKLEKMGAGAILAVGKGSERQPRMVIMRWNGAGKKKGAKTIGLVGKGVTFDTGGISLKPGAGMDEMKMDMGGSAAVVGTVKALAKSNAKVNVVAIIGLAENMPSSNAYRPGDIVTSLSGKTIEVLNTDAEGRLVLADCLTHIQSKYKPDIIIDLATLTGAMMVALAHEYCGTFVNNDELWKQLEKSSAGTGEKLWRMPLDDVWKKEMESTVADVQNLAKSGRWGGACTAAGFLEHFIEDGVEWAHMDIAGTAWRKSDKPTVPKFGTGFGVRVLHDWITQNYQ